MRYLNMSLSELVEESIAILENRIPRMTDNGARAAAQVVLNELRGWQLGNATTDDKGIHHSCFIVVGVIPAGAVVTPPDNAP